MEVTKWLPEAGLSACRSAVELDKERGHQRLRRGDAATTAPKAFGTVMCPIFSCGPHGGASCAASRSVRICSLP